MANRFRCNDLILAGTSISTIIGSTGQQLYNISIGGGLNLSGNLTQTGIQLKSLINILSGYLTGNYITGLIAGSNITVNDNNDGTFTINSSSSSTGSASPSYIANLITGGGNYGSLPLFIDNSGIGVSKIYQSPIGNIGFNNISPLFANDFSGRINVSLDNDINLATLTGTNNGYIQLNINNESTGPFASSDLVCTSDIGNESTFYVDLGKNGSRYTGQYIGGSGDGYVYNDGNDFYIGNISSGKNLYLFAGNVPYSGNMVAVTISQSRNVGIDNMFPQFDVDVNGSGRFSSGINSPNISLLKTTIPQSAQDSDYNLLYMENLAQRGILSYVNNRGIGKMIPNTFALENIHNFSPNTTTTMLVIGTTATSAGTLSHPVTYADITGAGFATNFQTATLVGGAAGIQSATTPFYLTSGTTGLGAGFFFASMFQLADVSGAYPPSSGLNTGINFFAGMTNAASIILSTTSAWNTASTLGFQFVRQSGISGRSDNNIQFVSKDNGVAAAFYIQDTNCPFVSKENYSAYLYGRNDFRNGVHWMIKRLDRGLVYSGDFTGGFNTLPLVSSAVQTFLKPTIGMNIIGSGIAVRNFKLKGLYCETV